MSPNHSLDPASSPNQGTQAVCAPTGAWRWLQDRRVLILGVVVIGFVALTLSWNSLAALGLLPLLYILPCMAMMYMCMKGMNHTGKAEKKTSPDVGAPNA